MEKNKLNDWEKAVDQSEESAMTADLPAEYPLGGKYIQEMNGALPRIWQRLEIVSGRTAGRWCYWFPWTTKNPHSGQIMPGLGANPHFKVIADTIFNGDAAHFVGMLGIPYTGKIPGIMTPAWVLISPRQAPPPSQQIIIGKPIGREERYERSGTVYNLDSQTESPIPGRRPGSA